MSLLFVALAVTSTVLQVGDHPLKRIVSPGLTAFTAAVVLFGTLLGQVPPLHGATVCAALLLLALSDFVFERSGERPELFATAMTAGVASGFLFGVLFHLVAASLVSPRVQLGCVVLAVAATGAVYRRLQVDPALATALRVYLLQAVILLAGGLACLLGGQAFFAAWGLLVFVSDALVGVRAFPNPARPVRWLTPARLLAAILAVYYPAQYALVLWATGGMR